VQFQIDRDPQPIYIAQYFTELRENFPMDPRKHAIGLTYCLQLRGAIKPQGEALDFAWFELNHLPSPEEFGFGMDLVVTECLKRIIKQ
jgi:hypothetical protein